MKTSLKFFPWICFFVWASVVQAQRLSPVEQIPMESYQTMREVERYQMKVAEKYYLKQEYKIAMAEYEKYLSLYESSSGAAYAQLMWSQCLVKLRKVNTAIREGFQSVIDYWPDAVEAKTAEYLIARAYLDMGEVEKAKLSFRAVIDNDAESSLAVFSRSSLLEIARTAQDDVAQLKLLDELTYKTERSDASKDVCAAASRELARYHAYRGNTREVIRALQTTYQGSSLDHHIYQYGSEGIRHLLRQEGGEAKVKSFASGLIEQLDGSIPDDLDSDSNLARANETFSRIIGLHTSAKNGEALLKTIERAEKLLGASDARLGQLAGYYKSVGERDKARSTYRKFEDQAKAKSHIALMLREEKKYQEAIDLYRELTQEDADRVDDYLWAIAECYEAEQDYKNAVQAYRQTDRYPANYLRMAQCHRRLKDWNEALGLYNQLKSSESHAAEAIYQMGHTYEEAGQRENAIKAFQSTCRNHPKSKAASRAHAHLQTKYQITATFGGAKAE